MKSHYLQGFKNIQTVVGNGISEPSTVSWDTWKYLNIFPTAGQDVVSKKKTEGSVGSKKKNSRHIRMEPYATVDGRNPAPPGMYKTL